jgi:Clp amino terminal domain, pathogenicity island component
MSSIRPLPARPSVEFDRKQAKALLKALRADDPEALGRAAQQMARSGKRATNAWTLTDAQRIVAREYGFTGWPRLLEYFATLDSHRNSPRRNRLDRPFEHVEREALGLVKRLAAGGDQYLARELTQYVPRYYRRSFDEIWATPLTIDEARLTVARRYRCASWDELLENIAATQQWEEQRRWQGTKAPETLARAAIHEHNLDALAALLDDHPEMLTPSAVARDWGVTLTRAAIAAETQTRSTEARRMTELLAAHGADVQTELNAALLAWWPRDRDSGDSLRWLLQRGADPNWIPPNGISVLEHAIARLRDPAAVDVLAAHVTPRQALWIAAGLGDVGGVRGFIAGRGRLTLAGRRNRPDCIAMGVVGAAGMFPPRHDADDLEIMWEAFRFAGLNERWNTMDALLDAGLPVDHAPLGVPLVAEAVPNFMVSLAKYLTSRGADLDRVWPLVGDSVRGHVRMWVEHLADPTAPEVQQMLDLCNAGTVAEILDARDAGRTSPPELDQMSREVLALAADDAASLGQASVTTENMLVGMLRWRGGVMAENFGAGGIDTAALHARLGDRLRPEGGPLGGAELPYDANAQAALELAVELAQSLRRADVHPFHLLYGIVRQQSGPGAVMLREAGMTETSFGEGYEYLKG